MSVIETSASPEPGTAVEFGAALELPRVAARPQHSPALWAASKPRRPFATAAPAASCAKR